LKPGGHAVFQVVPLDPEIVLAYAVAALSMKRTTVFRARCLGPATHQRNASPTFAAGQKPREQVNVLLLPAGKPRLTDSPEFLTNFKPPLDGREEFIRNDLQMRSFGHNPIRPGPTPIPETGPAPAVILPGIESLEERNFWEILPSLYPVVSRVDWLVRSLR
jgi:hypothetical protein